MPVKKRHFRPKTQGSSWLSMSLPSLDQITMVTDNSRMADVLECVPPPLNHHINTKVSTSEKPG